MRPVFIIGEQRSGSNLLRLMLSQAGIAAPHPPHMLKRLLPLEASYGDLTQDPNWKQLIEDACALVDRNPVRWTEVSPLNRDEVGRLCSERSVVAIFGAVMHLFAEARNASVWACKSMQYSDFLDQLEAYFDEPLYIYLYRDGRDVALSFKRAVVGEKHPYFVAKKWARLQDAAARVQDRVGPDRCFRLCYEELTREPEPILRALCSFLGVPFAPKMLEFHRSSDAKAASDKSQLWQNVGRPLIRNNSRKFLKGLSQDEIEIFESVAGAQLDRLGYDRVHVLAGNERVFVPDVIEAYAKENDQLKSERRYAMNAEDAERRAHQLSLLTERVQHLQNIPARLHSRLLGYLEEVHLSPGVAFIYAGEMDRSLFFIISGGVEVVGSSGEVVATFSKGRCVGEVGALSGLPRTRTVRTLEACRMFVLHHSKVRLMMLEAPELAAHLMWSINVTLAERFHHEVSLAGS